jgi:hypothetical protein
MNQEVIEVGRKSEFEAIWRMMEEMIKAESRLQTE